MLFPRDESELRVAVIGFGYIGSCIGVTLADVGMRVTGIDRDPDLIDAFNRNVCRIAEPGLAEALVRLHGSSRLAFSTDYAPAESADVVIITVDTPVEDGGLLMTESLEAVCRSLAPRLRGGQLVVLKSTVPPGHTRNVVLPMLESAGGRLGVDFELAFCPERLSEGNALAQLRELPIVVGGCDAASTEAASAFFSRALGVATLEFPVPEIAELVKLADNWWIDHNISMANDLARLCDAFGVDVLEVISGANSLPKGAGNVNILWPSVGVGGACLTKDPWMAAQAARGRGARLRTVETARCVNDDMPEYTSGAITDELVKLGKQPHRAKVAILGAAFKNDTGDLRATPVKHVAEHLQKAGVAVRVFDPLTDPDDIRSMFGLDPQDTLAGAVEGVDCVAVLAGHEPFQRLDFEALRERVADGCLLFDGRAYYPPATIQHLRDLGFTYRGVGRS